VKEIGGFFELELERKGVYHSRAISLNSGRSALRYIFRTQRPQKIYLPYYICNSVIEAAQQENIPIEHYHINEQFEPLLDEKSSCSGSLILYVNYFGINKGVIKSLSSNYDNLIIDNAQAFFSQPVKGMNTIYSPRKFFGVSDGGYLYTNFPSRQQLETDTSYDRCGHLLKRLDRGAQASYDLYKKNEKAFCSQPVKGMSKLTAAILSSINYDRVKTVREQNFLFLHEALKAYNELKIPIEEVNGPMVYPLLFTRKGVKNFLRQKKIYVATYWSEVLKRVSTGTTEHKLTEYLVPLPIDQRYGVQDMQIVVDTLIGFI
jgi:hypothetical protein